MPFFMVKDEAEIVSCDRQIADIFVKSLAGSYREGTLRSIMDIAEMFPGRPAGMYDIARGQCRSLSEDPRRTIRHGGRTARGPSEIFSPSRDYQRGGPW